MGRAILSKFTLPAFRIAVYGRYRKQKCSGYTGVPPVFTVTHWQRKMPKSGGAGKKYSACGKN